MGYGAEGAGLKAFFWVGCAGFLLSAVFLVGAGLDLPARLVFDIPRGKILLRDRKSRLLAEFPISILSGFSVCRIRSDGQSMYSAGMDLSGGGRWEFYSTGSLKRAEKFTADLSARIDLKYVPPGIMDTAVPPSAAGRRMRITQSGRSGFEASWSGSSGLLRDVAGIFCILSVGVVLSGARAFVHGASAQGLVVLLSFLFGLLSIYSVLAAFGSRSKLRVADGLLVREKKIFPFPGRITEIPLAGIGSVFCSITLSGSSSWIMLLRQGEEARYEAFRRGTTAPSEAVSMIGFLASLIKIDVSRLSLADRLLLAELLRDRIPR